MRAKFSKWGPISNYVGAHVVLKIGEREHLGEVRSMYREDTLGIWRIKVVYMNGTDWPIDPALSAVDILER